MPSRILRLTDNTTLVEEDNHTILMRLKILGLIKCTPSAHDADVYVCNGAVATIR